MLWRVARAASIAAATAGSAGVAAAPVAGAGVAGGDVDGGAAGRGCASATGATSRVTTWASPAAPCGGSVVPVGVSVAGASVFGASVFGASVAGWVGAAAGIAATGPPTTSRNRSCAVCPSDRAWSPSSPGTVIVMLVPSRTTSAPLTPRPFTRCSMIDCACRSCSRGGSPPDSVRAVSVTRVPPCRSMPSLGVALSPVKNTSA